jgi:hypothetical protein
MEFIEKSLADLHKTVRFLLVMFCLLELASIYTVSRLQRAEARLNGHAGRLSYAEDLLLHPRATRAPQDVAEAVVVESEPDDAAPQSPRKPKTTRNGPRPTIVPDLPDVSRETL